ncbi:phosphate/phosphite/phosphonate ABC transporter substrate-binding protein [Methylogaea oryzae]|uniref:Phosphonate ABC transporter substrate-binding protein n=1 Tax=Methylogaea oryzae TaxID=1295382 RepID=A0A8D5AJ81_9GAMM|nr:phosphate/phosphite/phosphonate ABC transporter substrate-binding protein [Methylogaea oryzae]BBL72131.1 phosphonate ABC transporter substrate-binding protein [Methylogaea oryzae]
MRLLYLLLFVGMLIGCEDASTTAAYHPQYSRSPPEPFKEYVFGVHPLHNPERLHVLFGPIMDHLSAHIPGASFRLEASRDYASFNDKLVRRDFDFALPNPYQTIKSLQHGYRVFGKMGDDFNFRGIILVRKDSPVREVADLKGLAVSFPAPTALAATMLPQYFLYQHGLDVMHDIDIRYVGSQESSIMSVHLGNVAAGATWPPPWQAFSREHPEVAENLRVAWTTESLPNNGLVARDDVPEAVVQEVARLLLTLHEDKDGKLWLARMALSRFEAADESTYKPVEEFLQRFGKQVRPVD